MRGPLIVGYDGSPGSNAALEEAIRLLGDEVGSEIVLVFGTAPPGTLGEEYRQHRTAIEEMARKATEPALERCRVAGVAARVDLRNEKPVDALMSAATEAGARMIVCGTYGESPLRGAVIGSTPHKLIHLTEVPVLVVPVL